LLGQSRHVSPGGKTDDLHTVRDVAGDFQGALADTSGGAKDDDTALSHNAGAQARRENVQWKIDICRQKKDDHPRRAKQKVRRL
jgi:hypothetical protein